MESKLGKPLWKKFIFVDGYMYSRARDSLPISVWIQTVSILDHSLGRLLARHVGSQIKTPIREYVEGKETEHGE